MLGPRRTVDEIPRPERALLPFDHEQRLAGEDEKAFLGLLRVVHRHRLSRAEDVQADAELGEPRGRTVERRPGAAALDLQPFGLPGVDDEPALGDWPEAVFRTLEEASGTTVSRLTPMEPSLPVAERPRRPEWMKVRAPSADSRYFDVKKLIHGERLHTICEEARCPNIAECWGRGTATFQILGDTCTRACRYCYVHSGRPDSPPDPLEPLRLANAAAQMELKHVVVTSVDRDDVADRGAGHYAATIRALEAQASGRLSRGADARLPRRRGGGAPHRARRAARRLQPQHRDRPPAARAHARREGVATTRRSGCSRGRRRSPTTRC